VQLIQAESDVRQGRFTLALLIGVPSVTNALVDDFAVPVTRAQRCNSSTRDAVPPGPARRAARIDAGAPQHPGSVAQYLPVRHVDVDRAACSEAYSSVTNGGAVLTREPALVLGRANSSGTCAPVVVAAQAALNESLGVAGAGMTCKRVRRPRDGRPAGSRSCATRFKHADQGSYRHAPRFQNGLGINLDVLTAQDCC
jgi:hypothetical protein